MKRRYLAAALVAAVGLAVAVLIAVLGFLASGYIPTAPGSYTVKTAVRVRARGA